MPYNNQDQEVNPTTRKWSKDWDLWSVGMMTLEIIVGSELVLLLDDHDKVLKLVMDIRYHIPTATHQLLQEMLFQVRDEHAVQNAKDGNIARKYKIEEAVNGMERAKEKNSLIRAKVGRFKEYEAENAEKLAMDFGWKRDLEM